MFKTHSFIQNNAAIGLAKYEVNSCVKISCLSVKAEYSYSNFNNKVTSTVGKESAKNIENSEQYYKSFEQTALGKTNDVRKPHQYDPGLSKKKYPQTC